MLRAGVRLVCAATLVTTVALTGCSSNSDLPAGVAAASGVAPRISGPTLDGTALPPLGGRVVLVNFWNPFCVPCRVESPVMEDTSERYSARGVVVVGVHYTGEQWPKSVDAALSFVEAAGVTYPVVGDPGAELATRFGIRAIPSTVIVDEAGDMRFRVLGKVTTPVLDDLLERVLSGSGEPTPD